MRILISAATGAAMAFAAPALAGGHDAGTHMQATLQQMPIWAYPAAENYCPAGLQPVILGGVICCGKPTHFGYASHPAPRKRERGPEASYVAIGKGFGEGYRDYSAGD